MDTETRTGILGKRSDFARRPQDTYDTPPEAAAPLLPHLRPGEVFFEPCAGAGKLIDFLEMAGHRCVGAIDIAPRDPRVARGDALKVVGECEWITNPPWDRKILHALLDHMRAIGVSGWLLLDANWAFTGQAAEYMKYCDRVVVIGRVIWIPGTKMTGKDDCAWFHFVPQRARWMRFFGKVGQVSRRSLGGAA